MKTATLSRWAHSRDATFGRLRVDDQSWFTIERSLTDAQHPCIPTGTYPLRLAAHHAGQSDAYPCYWVDDVPGRTAIEIHAANLASELRGCIALGRTLAVFGAAARWHIGVTSSRDALQEFMLTMAGEPGVLVVCDY